MALCFVAKALSQVHYLAAPARLRKLQMLTLKLERLNNNVPCTDFMRRKIHICIMTHVENWIPFSTHSYA